MATLTTRMSSPTMTVSSSLILKTRRKPRSSKCVDRSSFPLQSSTNGLSKMLTSYALPFACSYQNSNLW
jgi:hypothetical protein